MSPAATSNPGPVLNKTLKKKSLILEDGNVYKIQKVRQRKILSCIPCHQRKIKCSRGEICDHCLRNNLVCQRFINDKLSNLKKTEEHEEIKKSSTTSSKVKAITTTTPSRKLLMANPQTVRPTSKRSSTDSVRRRQIPDVIPQESPIALHPDESSSKTTPEVYSSPSVTGKNDSSPDSQATAQTSFYGDTGEEFTCTDTTTERPIMAPKLFVVYREIVPILNDLPSRNRSSLLLSTYVDSINPVLPIIDIISFKLKHEAFWNAGLNDTHNTELLFLGKQTFEKFEDFNDILEFLWIYSAVLYASAVARFQEQTCPTDESLQDEIDKYYKNFHNLNNIFLQNLKKLETLTFQVNTLMLSFGNLSEDRSLLEVTKLIKIAQYYQLDHDPVIHQNLNNKTLIQLRRLIWWQIFELDDIVSSYQQLPSTIKLYEFDTSLPAENSVQLLPTNDASSSLSATFCNYTICFANSKFRYYLLQNELNRLANGLNASLNDSDINSLKNKINDLYIFCYSSIITLQNTEKELEMALLQKQQETKMTLEQCENYFNQQSKFINYAKYLLSILADKILIKLQLRILATPSSVMNQTQQQSHDKFYSDHHDGMNNIMIHQPDRTKAKFRFMAVNLNLTISPELTSYNYNDLSQNLLPSLLHLLNEFIKMSEHKEPSGEGLNNFNWELRNYLPVEELILLTTIIVVNLKNKSATTSDINSKVFLIEKTLNLMILYWVDKSLGISKTMRILHCMWSLIKYKYNLDPKEKNCCRVPQPSLSPSAQSNPANQARTTISCSEIAPRTMRGQVSNTGTFPMIDLNQQNDPALFLENIEASDTNADILYPNAVGNSSDKFANDDIQIIRQLQDEVEYELQFTDQDELLEEHFKSLKEELADLFSLLYSQNS